jgi:Flp pilus assembly protein CpaB
MLFAAAAVFALVAALAAAGVLRSYLKLTDVVVAARDILPDRVIAAEDVTVASLPLRAAGGSASGIDEVAGKVCRGYVPAGMTVPLQSLSDAAAAGVSGRLAAYPGTAAMALNAAVDTTVGNSLLVGNKVDVYGILKEKAGMRLLAAAVPVLVTPAAEGGSGSAAKAVVVAVTPDQSSSILSARSEGADLVCVLRKAGD